MRQFPLLARTAQAIRWIGRQHTLPAKKTAPGANGRDAPGDGRLGIPLFVQPRQVSADQARRELGWLRRFCRKSTAEELKGLVQVFAVRLDGVDRGVLLQS